MNSALFSWFLSFFTIFRYFHEICVFHEFCVFHAFCVIFMNFGVKMEFAPMENLESDLKNWLGKRIVLKKEFVPSICAHAMRPGGGAGGPFRARPPGPPGPRMCDKCLLRTFFSIKFVYPISFSSHFPNSPLAQGRRF